VGAFRIDMGVIEIVGTGFGARAAIKAFRMLLVLWAERGCASRFSFSGLLRIVMCGGERDWLTEENGRILPGSIRMLLGLRGCASCFSFSGLLRMVMCTGEGDDQCIILSDGNERVLAALRRMLLVFRVERG
jgi:hypothetical protein